MKSSHCVGGTWKPEVSGSRAEVCWRLELSVLTGGRSSLLRFSVFLSVELGQRPICDGGCENPWTGMLCPSPGSAGMSHLGGTEGQWDRHYSCAHRLPDGKGRQTWWEPSQLEADAKGACRVLCGPDLGGKGGRSDKVSYCMFILKPRQEPVPAQCRVGEHCS